MPLNAIKRFGTAALALTSLVAQGCGTAEDPSTDTLKLGAYSVVREVFHEGILPAFSAEWKEKTGRNVRFEESYNASGAQARAIAAGFDADVAVLSHIGDIDLLVEAGRVRPDWDEGPDGGIITNSLVVIGVRPGNPKDIRDWADLARPGIGVLYPDPKTSGGARWNINAIYGSALLASREANGGQADEDAIRDLLAKVQANVVNMDPSGRQSMANFERGTGDAVVTYENELLLRKREGLEIPYVVPPATLRIEGPAVIVDRSVDQHGNRELAEAFLAFLRSGRGQAILADYGFRPASEGVSATVGETLPPGLFSMAGLGGWETVEEEVYGPKGLWTSIFTAQAGRR
ncbi:sulfate ABC transporter substrate-binding protein [Tautonia plasticadhaerens]|uniref:Sulfate-binding protein n=1 Tax=Tautonia plasticadhaerens TaxID=2527974 RepID=A0A518HF20_9BACT|nr:sulfate ABC transporter substrate-binding protein [Tautonia plasticadhaerens]QDV39434.1 Sulfate-binding protein precursor [Tautonia plasticadhaerens]